MKKETENKTIHIELYCRYKEKRVPLVDLLNVLLKQNEEKDKEIKRLWKRNKEVFYEMKDFINNLDIENGQKLTIYNHLATYLLFNTPIRKSDNNER